MVKINEEYTESLIHKRQTEKGPGLLQTFITVAWNMEQLVWTEACVMSRGKTVELHATTLPVGWDIILKETIDDRRG